MTDAPSLAGRTIAHYRVLEVLGSGGMGVVYRAHDEQLDRDIALKVLPPGLLADEAARKRFRNEAMALAKLNHPCIGTVHDFGSEGGLDFLVMELVQGVPLSRRLRDGPLDEAQTRRLGAQLAEGLAAAHAQGVIHRDLKPDNLHITPDGRLKILDFGLAKLFRPQTEIDQTQSLDDTHSVSGTLPYMSPEQLRADAVDSRTDIYGAGAVLYEMATAQRPFPENQPTRLIDAILHGSPKPLSSRGSSASVALESIIFKALEKEPAQRYQSARELLVALESGGVAVGPAPRPKWPLAAISLGLLVTVGAAIGMNLGKVRYRLGGWIHSGTAGVQPKVSTIPVRRSVAVLGFKNTSGRAEAAWLSTGLSEMLTTELGTGEKLRTVAEENVARAKLDLSLSDADSLAKDTLTRVRNNLGTDYVVLGSFVDLGKDAGGQVRVDMRLQDARTGETIGIVSETGKENELFDLVSRAGGDLRSKLGIGNISDAEAGSVRAAISTSPEASRLYAQGLEKLRLFDAPGARDLLEQAVAADPKYALAHSALSAAWSAMGYDAKAAEEAKKAFDLSGGLPREEHLAIEGRYYEAARNWPKAIEVYKTLWTFEPDNLDYGLRLAQVQTFGSQGKDALASVEALRSLPEPASDDPRIDLAEENAARSQSDFKRELAAAVRATEKGQKLGARLLVARAELAQGRAYYSLGDYPNFQAAAEAARRIYAETGDHSGEANALHNLGTGMYDHGDRANAQKLQQESLDTCRKIGNKRCQADAFNSIGVALKDQADFDGARKSYEASIAIHRETGDKIGEAVGVNNVAVLLYEQGKLAAAKKKYEESLAITREIGEKRGIARALTNLAIVLHEQGQLVESRKLHEQSLAMRREIGDKTGIGLALNNLAVVLLDQGDLAATQKALDEQMPIFQQAGVQRGVAYATFLQAEVQKEEGKLEEARKNHEQVLAMRNKLGEKTTAEDSLLALAQLSIEQGHAADAEQPARQVLSQAQTEKAAGNEINARVTLALSLLEQGKPAEAEKEIRAAENAVATAEGRLLAVGVAITAGRIHAANGKAGEASRSLQGALAEAARLDCGRCLLEARLALGETEMKQGKKAAAQEHLATLEKDAKAKGFELIARKADAAAAGK
ncbi:MAG TPA: tetratricopeptide repeat protein [Candidatus Cybelea sp.]|nr:tetratricopeptide repeat protein [Candidatus Cybelea sp.]